MTSGGRRAVLFDRDGTLNVSPEPYLTRVQDFVAIPGAFQAIARLTKAGWGVAMCTNQSGVGRGVIDPKALEAIHAECARLALTAGGRIEGFYVCPHRPDEGCSCRKPLPGLLQDAARVHEYDLSRSYFVGDSLRDLQSGHAAGATSLLVLTGDDPTARAAHPAGLTFADVGAAVDWILARTERAPGA